MLTTRQKVITGTKSALFTVRILKSEYKILKEVLEKYKMNMSQTHDYLISSGVCYLKPEIIGFIRQHIEAQKTLHKDKTQAMAEAMRTGKDKAKIKRDYTSYKELKLPMYQNEFVAFANYCIEEKVKKQWIFNVLFVEGLAKQDPIIISYIEKCLKENVVAKKRKVASAAVNDIIRSFDEDEAGRFVKEFTKQYDERKFDEFVHSKIVDIMNAEGASKQQIDNEINEMSTKFKKQKEKYISKFIDKEAK